MQRRKFVSLMLSGILAPEYLLKGRSMISVPQFSKIPTYSKYDLLMHDFRSELQLSKAYFKCITIPINGFWDANIT